MKLEDVTKSIRKVNIEDVIPDKSNPNEMTDAEMERLSKSLDVYGFVFPIVIDQNNIVIDGHHRLDLYRQKGMKQVPVIEMPIKSETQRKLLRQTLSKLHGSPNQEKELEELESIMATDAEMLYDLVGIDEQYVEDIKKAINLVEPKFKAPSEEAEEVMEDIGIKKVLHIPVSEELLLKIKQIMKDEGLEDYEQLLEKLVTIYEE